MKHYLHIDGYCFREQGIKQYSEVQKKKDKILYFTIKLHIGFVSKLNDVMGL